MEFFNAMRLRVRFYRSQGGNEPVRLWLVDLGKPVKQIIGYDIKTVQLGWPLGMPLVRKIVGKQRLWEVRSRLPNGLIARVFFTVIERSVSINEMILLHGIIKKTQKTPKADLDLAEKRKNEVLRYG